MADGSPGKYVVPVILEGFALAFAFHSADSFLDGNKDWTHSWGAAALTIVLSVAGFKWPWIKLKFAQYRRQVSLELASDEIKTLKDENGSLNLEVSTLKADNEALKSQAELTPILVEREHRENLFLKTRMADLEVQLETPRLVPEISRIEIFEEKGAPPGEMTRLTYGTNNKIRITMLLTVSNAHRPETKIIGFALSLLDGSRVVSSGELLHADPILSEPIKYALPINGRISFNLEHTSAESMIRRQVVVHIVDGTKQPSETTPFTVFGGLIKSLPEVS